jgi:hypothetical protein
VKGEHAAVPDFFSRSSVLHALSRTGTVRAGKSAHRVRVLPVCDGHVGLSPESTFCNTQVAEAPCTTFNCFVPALLQSGTGEPRHDIPLYSLPIRLTVVKIRPVSSPYRRLPRYVISAPPTLIPRERIPAFPSLLPQPLSLRKTLKTQRFKIKNIGWSLLHKTRFTTPSS